MENSSFDKIEMYLKGMLSPEEMASFEAELKSDQSLSEDLKLYKDIRTFLENYKRKEKFKINLHEINKEFVQEFAAKHNIATKKPLNLKWLYYSAAAVLIIAAVSAIVFTFTKTTKSVDTLFAENYDFKNNIAIRNTDSTSLKNIDKCFREFASSHFENAIACFKDIKPDENEYSFSLYYSGIANMEIKNYNQAASCFRKIIDSNNHNFLLYSKWYLALCYLKLNEVDKARVLFEDISKSENHYQNKAGNILKDL